jgi:TPR repeat protein
LGTTLFIRNQNASGGLPAAQLALARLYALGLGLPRDLRKAHEWATRAAAGGDPDAPHFLQNLNMDGAE